MNLESAFERLEELESEIKQLENSLESVSRLADILRAELEDDIDNSPAL